MSEPAEKLAIHLMEQEEYIFRLTSAIQRVRELHNPLTYSNGDSNECKEWQECEICQTKYPCDTIKYLDGEQ